VGRSPLPPPQMVGGSLSLKQGTHMYTVCQSTTLLYCITIMTWQLLTLLIFYANAFHISILKTLIQSRRFDHMQLIAAQAAENFSNFYWTWKFVNIFVTQPLTNHSFEPDKSGPHPNISVRCVFKTMIQFTERLVAFSAQFHCFYLHSDFL
jgi:hypothetical protein